MKADLNQLCSQNKLHFFKGYNYAIPHAAESEYWSELQTVSFVTRKMSWSRNFYIFGKFVDESAGADDTTISG